MSSARVSFQGDCSPPHGVGLGLRSPHFSYIEQTRPQVAWFEVLIDNYLGDGGSALFHLQQISQHYPLTFHGVGMSLGSTDELNWRYLHRLKQRMDEFQPLWVSDHLCWSSVGGHYAQDLLPLPYVQQAIDVVVDHIKQIQDFLGCRILIENVSSYLSYKDSVMQEWEFLCQVVERADCDVLLDINNIYVSAYNHGIDAQAYLNAVPVERVREFHLAGYDDLQTHLLDTHGAAVHAPVWALYQDALQRFGPVPTLIEWDNNIPDFTILQTEAAKAEEFMSQAARHVA